MSLTTRMPTREEREVLILSAVPHYTAFTPRPVEQLSTKRTPTSSLNIECNHRLRNDMNDCIRRNPSIQYRLWLEAGKHEPPFPAKPDPSYNSNVWRNFRRQFGFSTNASGRKIPDVIAAMYPLNIPQSSKVGDHTYAKYIQESRMFENDKYKTMVIKRTKADVTEFKRMKTQSEARNPPIGEDGSILPPENFKRYVPRFIPPSEPSQAKPESYSASMLDQRTVPISKPPLWKLTYTLNHPKYDELKKEIEKRKKIMEGQRSGNQSRVIPTPNSSTGD